MEGTSPLTLNYLTQLSLFLAPIPTLSSSTSISLSQHLSNGLPLISRYTKCSKCFNEIIGGINGSYRRVGGKGFRFCESCRWVTKIDEKSAFVEGKRGKEAFKKVKGKSMSSSNASGTSQSRSTQEESPIIIEKEIKIIESSTHINLSSQPPPTVVSKPIPFSHKLAQSTSLSRPAATSAKPSAPPSIQSTPIPSPYSSNNSSRASTPLAAPYKSLPSTSTTSNNVNANSNTKRKRSKHSSGLAEMLEAKKREKLKEQGGLGLKDFLQGM